MNNFDNVPVFTGSKEEIMDAKNELVNAAKSGKSMVQIKSSYVTAISVQRPRSITEVADKVFEEARLAGADFFYRWKVKNKDGSTGIIQGGSIDIAMAFARNFSNCASDIEVNETQTHFVFKASVIDLETGFTFPRLFRQRKNQRMSKKMDIDRAEDIAFQIGQSKAQRNVWLKIMPNWMLSKAITIAMDAESTGITDLSKAKEMSKNYFLNLGVSNSKLENYVGKNFDLWTKFDIVELRAVATAIKENRTNIREVFLSDEENNKEPDKTGQSVRKKESGTLEAENQKTQKKVETEIIEEKETIQVDEKKKKKKSVSKNKSQKHEHIHEEVVGEVDKSTIERRERIEFFKSNHAEIYHQVLKDLEFDSKKLTLDQEKQVVVECEMIISEINEKKEIIKDPDKMQEVVEEEMSSASEGKAEMNNVQSTEDSGQNTSSVGIQEPPDEENVFITLRKIFSNDRAGIMKIKKELEIDSNEYTAETATRIVNAYKARKGSKSAEVDY